MAGSKRTKIRQAMGRKSRQLLRIFGCSRMLGSDLPPGKVARIPLLLFAPPLSLDLDQARDEDDCANMSQTILSYLAHLCSLDVAI